MYSTLAGACFGSLSVVYSRLLGAYTSWSFFISLYRITRRMYSTLAGACFGSLSVVYSTLAGASVKSVEDQSRYRIQITLFISLQKITGNS